jgi:hypothetical protein
MNNWSSGDFKSVNTCDYRAFYGECENVYCDACRLAFACFNFQQCAGRNDKKWNDEVLFKLGKLGLWRKFIDSKLNDANRSCIYCNTANTRQYTPEQQEMIDKIDEILCNDYYGLDFDNFEYHNEKPPEYNQYCIDILQICIDQYRSQK